MVQAYSVCHHSVCSIVHVGMLRSILNVSLRLTLKINAKRNQSSLIIVQFYLQVATHSAVEWKLQLHVGKNEPLMSQVVIYTLTEYRN